MFRQATVDDVAKSRVTKRHGRIVVVTRFYPRFMPRGLIDAYVSALAPEKALLKEFKAREAELDDHDRAFDDMEYETKFTLGRDGVVRLEELAAIARERDVYLICHCKVGQRCHREILMLLAHEWFHAPIGKLHFPWSGIRARLAPKGDSSAGGRKGHGHHDRTLVRDDGV